MCTIPDCEYISNTGKCAKCFESGTINLSHQGDGVNYLLTMRTVAPYLWDGRCYKDCS